MYQCGGAEDGRVVGLQFRELDGDTVFVDVEQVFGEVAAQGGEQGLAGAGGAAHEEEGLGGAERGGVGHAEGEPVGRCVVRFKGQRVARYGHLAHILAGELSTFEIVREFAFGCLFAVSLADAAGRGVHLQAALPSAAAEPVAERVDDGVTEFAGHAAVPVDEAAIDEDAAAHAGAEGDGHEMLHQLRAAVDVLADGGGVRVVGERDRQSEDVLEHAADRDFLLHPQVGGFRADAARVEVCVGRADADAADFREAVLPQQGGDGLRDVQDVRAVVNVVPGLQDLVLQHFAIGVHESDVRIGAADVDANGEVVHNGWFFIRER